LLPQIVLPVLLWYQSHSQNSTTTLTMSDKKGTEDGFSQRKTISPYDITSLDNPGLSITQVQLKGENYNEWACSFRTALRARKKFEFVDGTIKRPDENSEDLED